MSSDMSAPLSGMPAGTILNAQVANSCVPAGDSPNKTPIFVSGVSETLVFLAKLRPFCLICPTAQIKGKNFRSFHQGLGAAVSSLRSFDGKDYVRFHSFTLPEDRCVRLLVTDLGKGKRESVALEELESLNIRVQGVTQLRSGRRD